MVLIVTYTHWRDIHIKGCYGSICVPDWRSLKLFYIQEIDKKSLNIDFFLKHNQVKGVGISKVFCKCASSVFLQFGKGNTPVLSSLYQSFACSKPTEYVCLNIHVKLIYGTATSARRREFYGVQLKALWTWRAETSNTLSVQSSRGYLCRN